MALKPKNAPKKTNGTCESATEFGKGNAGGASQQPNARQVPSRSVVRGCGDEAYRDAEPHEQQCDHGAERDGT